MALKTYTLGLEFGSNLAPNVQSNQTATQIAEEILRYSRKATTCCKSMIIIDHELDRSFRLSWEDNADTED